LKAHNQIMLGLVTGAGAGVATHVLAPGAKWVDFVVRNVATPVGQIFLRLLLMTVVPLVFASITLGVYGLGNLRRAGRLGGATLAYFLLSTTIATVIGLALVNTIRPGAAVAPEVREALIATYQQEAGSLQERAVAPGIDLLVNIVPRNPVRAAADMDMLGVIFFSLMFGAALTYLTPERARPMVALVEVLGEVIMRIIHFAMRLAPYGVFGLIFAVTARFGWSLLGQLGVYAGVVLGGLLLHGAGTLSILVKVLGRRSPWDFWRRIRASVITAFSTSSSNATLPTSIAVAEEQLGVPGYVARFVLPLGATMNMNGTALYEGVTVLFLAQVFGLHLSLGQQVFVVLFSVVTAIGAAGVPGGSLPLMMVVMASVGVPPESIAIILGIDRILDMARTTLNVAGDLSATVAVQRTEPSSVDEAVLQRAPSAA
jgi:dicarboxylate/amino acid:cation (Na+ or H+) symporter, DAACS family